MFYSFANAQSKYADGKSDGRLQSKPMQYARFGWSNQPIA
jgi:hypothetical protein